jgi:hypothetical protein
MSVLHTDTHTRPQMDSLWLIEDSSVELSPNHCLASAMNMCVYQVFVWLQGVVCVCLLGRDTHKPLCVAE